MVGVLVVVNVPQPEKPCSRAISVGHVKELKIFVDLPQLPEAKISCAMIFCFSETMEDQSV
jgi:hypothetical protein